MRKSLLIDDFSGGRNSLDAVNLIKKNQHSAGDNVWTEFKALSKRRGFTRVDLPAPSGTFTNFKLQQLKVSSMAASGLARLLMIAKMNPGGGTIRSLCYTENGTSVTLAGYTVGTCSTAGSSTTVTGSGTAWSTHAKIGDYFIAAGGVAIRIENVVSDTEITLLIAVNLSAGTAYKIAQTMTADRIIAWALMDVSGSQNLFYTDRSSDGRFRFNGTDVTRVTYIPTDTVSLLNFKNYLFAVRITTIEWSVIKDPTSFPAANTQTVTSTDDPLRGGVVYGNSVVMWTRSRMFRLVGDVFDPANPSYVLEEIPAPKGFNFSFSRSVVAHQGILKFLTTEGWYGYDGNEVVKLSQPIQPEVDALDKPYLELEEVESGAVAIGWKGRMWCAAALSGANNKKIYVHDERGAWWQWSFASTGVQITDFAIVKFGTTGDYKLLGVSGLDSGLLTLDSGDTETYLELDVAINGTWTSKEFFAGSEITFIEAIVTMKKQSAGNLTLEFSIDRASFISKTLDMTAGVGTVIVKKAPIARSGKTIRVRPSNNVASQPFEIYSIEIIYEDSDGERT